MGAAPTETMTLKPASAFWYNGAADTEVLMAKTTRLDGARLREPARIGAEVTLRRLRAEIVAIERTSNWQPPC